MEKDAAGYPQGHTNPGISRTSPAAYPTSRLSFTHISVLTEVLTVINLGAIFHNTAHLFELSAKSNENTIAV